MFHFYEGKFTDFMKKTFLTILLTLVCMPVLLAGKNQRPEPREEKIVNAKWSLNFGSGSVANHYLSEYEYAGRLYGLQAEFGAFYKRSENLSWDLDLSLTSTMTFSGKIYDAGLANPTETNFWMLKNYSVKYGTSYNWNPAPNLYLRTGGTFELFLGSNSCLPDNINNSSDFDFMPQLNASAGIKYGWTLKKFSLYMYGDFEMPVLGGALVSSKYQSSASHLFHDVDHGGKNIFILTSFHNMQGFNSEIGVDFSFNKWSLFVAHKMFNRWWNAYDSQNYRKYDMLKIGVAVDLVSRPHVKCNGRYF